MQDTEKLQKIKLNKKFLYKFYEILGKMHLSERKFLRTKLIEAGLSSYKTVDAIMDADYENARTVMNDLRWPILLDIFNEHVEHPENRAWTQEDFKNTKV